MKKHILFLLLLAVISIGGCRTNESPKAQVDDLKITAEVKSKLATEVGLSSITDIAINSTNGVVTLSGQVDSADARGKAIAVARSVPNVSRVVDNLQVAGKPGPSAGS
jgi:osmotically-inducible protein OsmY